MTKLAKSTFHAKTDRWQFTKKAVIEAPAILRPAKQTTYIDGLTGSVRGRDASDIEERFANALDKVGIPFRFQRYVPTEYTLPDNEKQVDFVVYWRDNVWPVEIYGSYWHSSAAAAFRDQERERQLNIMFRAWGWEDIQVVWDWELYDEHAALGKVRQMFT